jgi:hypothetical protein
VAVRLVGTINDQPDGGNEAVTSGWIRISVLRSDDVVVSFLAGGGGCLHECGHLNSFFEWVFGFVLIW